MQTQVHLLTGAECRSRRKELELSRSELARLALVDEATVYRLEPWTAGTARVGEVEAEQRLARVMENRDAVGDDELAVPALTLSIGFLGVGEMRARIVTFSLITCSNLKTAVLQALAHDFFEEFGLCRVCDEQMEASVEVLVWLGAVEPTIEPGKALAVEFGWRKREDRHGFGLHSLALPLADRRCCVGSAVRKAPFPGPF